MHKKNRVLLLTFRPLIGPIAVGSALRHFRRVEVDIVVLSHRERGELSIGEIESPEIQTILKPFLGPDLLWVGLTVFTSFISSALKTSALIKAFDPSLPVVWGGVHPSIYPLQPLESPWVDVSVVGDGEITACELVDACRNERELEDVLGIAFRQDGGVQLNPTRQHTRLTEMPLQDYSLVRTRKILFEKKYCFKRIISVHVANGCPFKCSFCINTSQKRSHSRKDPEQVVEQVAHLHRQYGVDEIDFIDELFLVDRSWLADFLDLLDKRGLRVAWRANGHAATLADRRNYPDDLLNRLVCMGLKMTTMGAESGSIGQLRLINKTITPETVLTAVGRVRDHRLYCGLTYLIGMPREEVADMHQTLGHMLDVHRHGGGYPFLALQEYRPYPHNPMFQNAVAAGFRDPDRLTDWQACIDFNSGGFKWSAMLPWITPEKRRVIDLAFEIQNFCNRVLNEKWEIPWRPKSYATADTVAAIMTDPLFDRGAHR